MNTRHTVLIPPLHILFTDSCSRRFRFALDDEHSGLIAAIKLNINLHIQTPLPCLQKAAFDVLDEAADDQFKQCSAKIVCCPFNL
ncbi:hypothetical protein CH341_32385, partial [Rhodoplanes roseus]